VAHSANRPVTLFDAAKLYDTEHLRSGQVFMVNSHLIEVN
jgi:hypothetical protein